MTDVHIPPSAIKGRGVSHRQPHRFERDQRDPFDDGWGTLDSGQAEGDEAAAPATQVTFEQARSAITRNDSPDIGFNLGLNPYRGCEHVMEREKLLSEEQQKVWLTGSNSRVAPYLPVCAHHG